MLPNFFKDIPLQLVSPEKGIEFLRVPHQNLKYKFKVQIPLNIVEKCNSDNISIIDLISKTMQSNVLDNCERVSSKEMILNNVKLIQDNDVICFIWDDANEHHASKIRFLVQYLFTGQ